ncbi:MAG: PmbA/TldA family metallopeptidase, partial [Steroidobacteraceae bacterium]
MATTSDALHIDLPQPQPSYQPIELARRAILTPSGLDEDRIARVLGTVMGHSVDYADLYFQLVREESWSLEDSIVKDGSYSVEQGVGVRALAGEKTGFAYSDEIVLPALTEATQAARAIARSGATGSMQAWHASAGHQLYLPDDPLEGLSDAEKVRLLERVDVEARRIDPRVTQVMASLSAAHEVVLVMASDGTVAAD